MCCLHSAAGDLSGRAIQACLQREGGLTSTDQASSESILSVKISSLFNVSKRKLKNSTSDMPVIMYMLGENRKRTTETEKEKLNRKEGGRKLERDSGIPQWKE